MYLSHSLLTVAMNRLVQLLTDPALTPKILATALTTVCNGEKRETKKGKNQELSDCVSTGLEWQTSASPLVVCRFSCQHIIKRACRIAIVPQPKKCNLLHTIRRDRLPSMRTSITEVLIKKVGQ